MRMQKGDLTRRAFVKGATAAVIGLPCVIASSALGAGGRPNASDRIVMGSIGVGGMGTGDMQGFLGRPQVQYVAVCDVDADHRTNAKNIVDQAYGNSDCRAYLDFREMIEREDLDAVCLALPDHWHALTAVTAARAGLDIYGEKPLARSIREGRAICDAVHRYGCVWQTGSQQRSDRSFRRACELVRNGRIGKVHMVEVGLPTGSPTDPEPPQPVPPGLDWDFWLGPAPWAPYTPKRCHWNWRWIMDYSGGQLTDWGGHHIDIAHWGLGLEHTGPVELEGEGRYPEDGLWDAPTEYKFTCKYANGLTMVVANNSQLDQGVRWHGERGWIYVRRGFLDADPKGVLNEVIGPGEVKLYESNDHGQNFLDCVRSRELTVAPVEVGHRSISVALLGEIAMLVGRRIRWDPDKEEIIGDPSAAALLGRSYREPWHL